MARSGFTVWKRKADRRRRDAKWRITYTDEDGRRRTATAYTDRQASYELARRLVKEAAQKAEGLIDPFAEHRRTPIMAVLDEFRDDLAGKGRSSRYVQQVRNRILRIILGTKVKILGDIDPVAVSRFVSGLSDEGVSETTRNEYIGSIKSFAAWVVMNRRLPENPLASLRVSERRGIEPVHPRRALSAGELARLLDAAERRPLLEVRTIRTGSNKGKAIAKVSPEVAEKVRRLGAERRLVYLIALWTGLRRGEIRQLTWGDVRLDSIPAKIQLRAKTTKSKRSDNIPLHPQLAEALREARPAKASGAERVVNTVPNMKVLKADLKLAGIPYVDDRDLYADFHSLRGSLATRLSAQGVSLRIVQAVMRHTDPRLTAKAYTDERLLPLAEALSTAQPIPTVEEVQRQPIPLRATGTDNQATVARSAGAALCAQTGDGGEGQVMTVSGGQASSAPNLASTQVFGVSLPVINEQDPPPYGDRSCSKAGDEIRTHDIHVGNVTLYH
jgi:integrase